MRFVHGFGVTMPLSADRHFGCLLLEAASHSTLRDRSKSEESRGSEIKPLSPWSAVLAASETIADESVEVSALGEGVPKPSIGLRWHILIVIAVSACHEPDR